MPFRKLAPAFAHLHQSEIFASSVVFAVVRLPTHLAPWLPPVVPVPMVELLQRLGYAAVGTTLHLLRVEIVADGAN